MCVGLFSCDEFAKTQLNMTSQIAGPGSDLILKCKSGAASLKL